MKRPLMLLAVLLAAAIPALALAHGAGLDDDSVLVAIDRDVRIAADETVGTLVVVSGDSFVAGHVQTVFVIDGSLTVGGKVDESIVAVESDVTLGATAVIGQDIMLAGGALTRDSAATVGGSVRRDFDARFGWVLTVVSILFWIGLTVGFMLAGVVLVAVAKRQVGGVGDLLSDSPGPAVLATVAMIIGLPLLAVASIATLLGLPVGIGLLLLVLPSLWIVGYLVASARLGRAILEITRGGAAASPHVAVVVGLAILQVFGLVPVIGGLAIVLAGTYGAGGLVLYAWRSWRGATAEMPA